MARSHRRDGHIPDSNLVASVFGREIDGNEEGSNQQSPGQESGIQEIQSTLNEVEMMYHGSDSKSAPRVMYRTPPGTDMIRSRLFHSQMIGFPSLLEPI